MAPANLSREKVTFLSLPNELILDIADFLLPSLRDVNSLLQISRKLSSLLTPFLHRSSVTPEAVAWAKCTGSRSNMSDRSVFHWAATHGDVGLMKRLLPYCETRLMNTIDPDNGYPLFSAVLGGHNDAVEFLLQHGANPNLSYWFRYPSPRPNMPFRVRMMGDLTHDFNPVVCAVLFAQHITLQCLVEAGADLNVVVSKEIGTPLHIAATYGDEKSVIILLKGGASFHITDMHGYTPIHRAQLLNQASVLRVFQGVGLVETTPFRVYRPWDPLFAWHITNSMLYTLEVWEYDEIYAHGCKACLGKNKEGSILCYAYEFERLKRRPSKPSLLEETRQWLGNPLLRSEYFNMGDVWRDGWGHRLPWFPECDYPGWT